jgi:hypothetical protein
LSGAAAGGEDALTVGTAPAVARDGSSSPVQPASSNQNVARWSLIRR